VEDLKGCGGWDFTKVIKVKPGISAPRSQDWAQFPCNNIVTPPGKDLHPDGKQFFPLDRKIELALRLEKKNLEKPTLFLPNDWKAGGFLCLDLF